MDTWRWWGVSGGADGKSANSVSDFRVQLPVQIDLASPAPKGRMIPARDRLFSTVNVSLQMTIVRLVGGEKNTPGSQAVRRLAFAVPTALGRRAFVVRQISRNQVLQAFSSSSLLSPSFCWFLPPLLFQLNAPSSAPEDALTLRRLSWRTDVVRVIVRQR